MSSLGLGRPGRLQLPALLRPSTCWRWSSLAGRTSTKQYSSTTNSILYSSLDKMDQDYGYDDDNDVNEVNIIGTMSGKIFPLIITG